MQRAVVADWRLRVEQVKHIIDGKLMGSLDGRSFQSIDPYTRAPWAEVALGGAPEIEMAVAAARRAFDEGPWPQLSAKERRQRLGRLCTLLEENASDLALCDTRDMGAPVGDGKGAGIKHVAQNFQAYADQAVLAGTEGFTLGVGQSLDVDHVPAGVVAAITPWNFPTMMAISKLAPALAWGNTVVLKPAEQSPTSASKIAILALEAGLPEGVVNVVHGMGPGSAGGALASSAQIDRLTFTGSTAAGAAIAREAAAHLVPVTLECGGKSASMIFADADLDIAVRTTARSIFGNSGQTCVANSRMFVHESVFDETIDALINEAAKWVPGDPKEQGTTLGPLVSEEQYERVCGYLELVPAEGGEIVTGGSLGDGWFVAPTVVTGLERSARVCREEIFGPVIVVSSFTDEDEVVQLVNDTEYGLSASLFTRDLSRAHRVSRRVLAGSVWVNTYGVLDSRVPFGGFKRSGLGREGGEHSRLFYTEARAVAMNF